MQVRSKFQKSYIQSKMKTVLFFAFVLLTSFTSTFAQNADAITGVWLSADKDAKIEIYRSGNKYFGKIIWTKNMYEADGKTLRKDHKNPQANLRNRNILNLVMLTNFTYDDGEWTGGEVYDPKSGKTYNSKMKLKGNALELRGYVGISLFGRSTVWTRG